MYLGNCQTVGTCSICGGAVQLPLAWWSVVPPVPTCSRCGAVQRQAYGPVIDMQPAWPPARVFPCVPVETPEERKRRKYREQWNDLRVPRCRC